MVRCNIILLMMTLSIFSCKKSDPTQDVVVDSNADIRLVNSNGENLLDPSAPNSFNKNSIKIYYLINGEKIEMFNNSLDAPQQYNIYQVEAHSNNYPGEFIMRIFLNKDGVKIKDRIEETVTYIEWNNTQTDTLVAQVHRYDRSVFIEKISYNNDVKWDITSTPKIEDTSFYGRFFQVVK